ncbi:sulfatase-like hydrolase/transferase [Paraglaciecola sp.]|uniref:sulfatase-like hydrolase/transferase n=1 Tax=Paraglaciecola sp. TaxID=1920173 RepID=UPI003EF34B6D
MHNQINCRLTVILFLITVQACSSAKNIPIQPALPNIVLFLVDDMGPMDTSVPMLVNTEDKAVIHQLNHFYNTPKMQNMADKGIRFSQFYAHSVCSPTRASIFTGQNSARQGTTQWINPVENNKGQYGPSKWNWSGLKNGDAVLVDMLNNLGYQTIHVGKGHFGPMDHEGANPLKLGFKQNIGGAYQGAPGSYYGQDDYGFKTRKLYGVPHLEKYHGSDTYLTEALTLEANRAISESTDNNQPFFLYMSHYGVHTPFQDDPRFLANYKDKKTAYAQIYASMIEGVDKSLGDIEQHLKQLGIAENTLVIFVGDNGSTAPLSNKTKQRFEPYTHSSSAPLRGMKGTSYEGGMRVPFMAAWSQLNSSNYWQQILTIKPGAINTQIGTILDILPTVQHLVTGNLPKDHILDGENLSIQLSGNHNSKRSESFLNHFPHVHRSSYFTSYIEGDWKLVYYYPLEESVKQKDPLRKNGLAEYRLFNLKNDPYEQHNLASSNKDQLRTMLRKMNQDLQHKNAQFPEYNSKLLIPQLP